MSAPISPSYSQPTGEGGPDDVDRAFSAFFRAETPSPWPRLAAPAVTVRPSSPASDGLGHSRVVLAASILALLVGGWLLSGRLLAPLGSPAALHEGTATVPPELRHNSGGPRR